MSNYNKPGARSERVEHQLVEELVADPSSPVAGSDVLGADRKLDGRRPR